MTAAMTPRARTAARTGVRAPSAGAGPAWRRRSDRQVGSGGPDRHAALRTRASMQRSHSPPASSLDDTSVTIRQHRAHLSPVGARRPSTSRHPDRRRSPVAASTCDTMNSIGSRPRSDSSSSAASPPRADRRRAPRASCRSSCSWRAASSARFTSSRTAISRSHRATSAGSTQRFDVRLRGNSARWTDCSRCPGQVPPHLVRRDRQDRREQPRQPVGDDVHRRLRRAPLRRVGARTCRADPSRRRRRTRTGPPSSAALTRWKIAGKIVGVVGVEHVARDVSRSAPARSDRPPASRRAARHPSPDRSRRGWRAGSGSVLRIFRYASTTRCRICLPTRSSSRKSLIATQSRSDLGAALLDDFLRRDGVAERLRHLAAVDVDHEAVGEHFAERRASARARGRPAASSGTSRDADRCPRDRCRPATSARRGTAARPRGSSPSRTRRRGCRVSRSNAVPPHVGHASPGGRNSVGRPLVPGVGAVRRRTPTPPARPAPASGPPRRTSCSPPPGSARPTRAGARCTSRGGSRHVVDAVAAPGRDPLRRRGRWPRAPASRSVRVLPADGRLAVHADEPLRRREEDHRVVAAPAVRIRCWKVSRCQSRPRSFSASSILGFASKTRWPPNSSTVSRKCRPGPTGA